MTSAATAVSPALEARRDSGYGRSRLWLGISTVGSFVMLSVIALALGLPERLSVSVMSAVVEHLSMIAAFVVLYAGLHVPFDILGGWMLPRSFGRSHPPFFRFIVRLLRGVAVHSVMLFASGAVIMLGGRAAGVFGAIAAAMVATLVLLGARRHLAGWLSALPVCAAGTSATKRGRHEPVVALVASDDEGYTGGIDGVLSARRILMPEHWRVVLQPKAFELTRRRREIAIESGAWRRGRLVALGFTWVGLVVSILIVGSPAIGTAIGVVKMSLLFTLWSFAGLLALPTISRAGVAAVDATLRREGAAPELIEETVRRLDALQDGEPSRPAFVESIFHPVPSVTNRVGAMNPSTSGGVWDPARTTVFLSVAGLGLLGRAVHCNCGRPALWAFLPVD